MTKCHEVAREVEPRLGTKLGHTALKQRVAPRLVVATKGYEYPSGLVRKWLGQL